MQTFLPYFDFCMSARCLDYRRLGKQRIEAKQIYFALTKKNYGWKNHPAVKMWKGHEALLLYYGYVMSLEWASRGYKDNQADWFEKELKKFNNKPATGKPASWLLSRRLRDSHRSNLVRKYPEHYRKYFPKIKDNIPYYWPVK